MYTKRRQEQTESKTEIIDDNTIKVINRKHELFLSMAAKIAEKSTMLQKHGAIIVYKNKIIASGYNYRCSYMNTNFSIHAEIAAITNLFHNKKVLPYCDIYVVRIAPDTYDKCLINSKPCLSCTNFIVKYNLKNIYYSTNYNYESLFLNIQ